MMVQAAAEGGREAYLLSGAYPWGELGLGESGGTVVDVGGGNGHVSFALARARPGLRFVGAGFAGGGGGG